MENGGYEHQRQEKQDLSTNPSMYPPNSNNPESTSSAQPPPYPTPSQYPPAYGINYTQQYPPPNPGMGYPQPYGPPPGGQPYYLQPGVVYPGAPGPNYQTPNPQQQQQFIVVSNQQIGVQPVFFAGATRVSMVGAIVLSCIAFWFFGVVFGLIAFILAMVGQSSVSAGDIPGAIRLRNASYGVSITGIAIGIIIIIVLASALGSRSYYPYYHYYG